MSIDWNNPAVQAALNLVVYPPVSIALAALAAWCVTHAPGPLKRWLQSGTHQRDMQAFGNALFRGALLEIQKGSKGAAIAMGAISYAQANVPEIIAKLGPSDDALQAHAAEAQVKAEAITAAPVQVAPDGAVVAKDGVA